MKCFGALLDWHGINLLHILEPAITYPSGILGSENFIEICEIAFPILSWTAPVFIALERKSFVIQTKPPEDIINEYGNSFVPSQNSMVVMMMFCYSSSLFKNCS